MLIDSPDFTHRIAQALKRRDRTIPTANYVAPQVWASRPYRARKMARYFDAVLTLLPFEAPFFERYGIKTISSAIRCSSARARMTGGKEFRRRHGIAADATVLAVLPGSRRNEIRFILPVFKQAVAPPDGRTWPNLGAPDRAARRGAGEARRRGLADAAARRRRRDEKFAAFDAADVALAASGTVTTELALARRRWWSAKIGLAHLCAGDRSSTRHTR